ncbi:MAG: LapA family protein [Actinotalea sp.]|nr:LapA family protein [Actinotalea sp.]
MTSPTAPARRSVTSRQVLALVVAAVVVVFIAQNRAETQIAFLGLTVVLPLWLVLTLVTALGAAVGWLLASRRRRR